MIRIRAELLALASKLKTGKTISRIRSTLRFDDGTSARLGGVLMTGVKRIAIIVAALFSVIRFASAQSPDFPEAEQFHDPTSAQPLFDFKCPPSFSVHAIESDEIRFHLFDDQTDRWKRKQRALEPVQAIVCLSRRLEEMQTAQAKTAGDTAANQFTLVKQGDALVSLIENLKNQRPAQIIVQAPSTAGDPHRLVDLEKTNIALNTQADALQALAVNLKDLPERLEAASLAKEGAASAVSKQIDATTSVATYYPSLADLSMSILTVPDPRVPRHRRAYEQTLAALTQGMLNNGYVLDRYTFPWQDTLLQSTPQSQTVTNDNGEYGLVLFRKDGWRYAPTLPGTYIQAVYVVPETATYGVAGMSLRCAVNQIETQIWPQHLTEADAKEVPKQTLKRMKNFCKPTNQFSTTSSIDKNKTTKLARYPLCHDGTLVIFGPFFSGSLDSILQANQMLSRRSYGPEGEDLCLVSSTATAKTNEEIANLPSIQPRIQYVPLAVTDAQKLKSLTTLTVQLGIRKFNRVAIMCEASVFGLGVCQSFPSVGIKPVDCRKISTEPNDWERLRSCSQKIYFPANIADIRYQHRKNEDKRRDRAPLRIPEGERHLQLDEGAENGSEYPDSIQSPLTTVSTELELLDAIARLGKLEPPQVIVIVATDVRDRLFLIDLVRERIPNALIVDFEADRLLAHPDFVHASRGAIVLSSSELLCETNPDQKYFCQHTSDQRSTTKEEQIPGPVSAWASDRDAILQKAVALIGLRRELVGALPDIARSPIVHVVGLDGLLSVSPSWQTSPKFGSSLNGTNSKHVIAIFFFVLLLILWIVTMLFLVQICLVPKYASFPELSIQTEERTRRERFFQWVFAGLLLVLVPMLGFAPLLRVMDTINHGPSIKLLVSFLIGGVVAAWILSVPIHALIRASAQLCVATLLPNIPELKFGRLSGSLIQVLTGVAALLIFFGWSFSTSNDSESTKELLDPMELTELSLSLHSGLAYRLALMLAYLTIIYFVVTVASCAKVGLRNRWLLSSEQVPDPLDQADVLKLYRRVLPPVESWAAIVGVIILAGVAALSDGLRLTIFGPNVSRIMAGAFITVTICGVLLLTLAFRLSNRTLTLAAFLKPVIDATGGFSETGFWTSRFPKPLSFVATPVLTEISDGKWHSEQLVAPSAIADWRARVRQFMGGYAGDAGHGIALFALLASEVSLFRRVSFAAAICALTGIGMNYLFPMTGAGGFLLLNLSVLVGVGVWSGYSAVAFERDKVLSGVLCDTSPAVNYSVNLFGYIAVPFAAFAIAIAISQIPGVVDWDAGLLSVLVKKLGLGDAH